MRMGFFPLREPSIDLPAMSYGDDLNDQNTVEDRIDDSVLPDPDPVGMIAPEKLLATWRTGFLGQGLDSFE